MSNVQVKVGSKGMVIALIIGVLLLGGGGGYLLWRVNQPKTVAPTESDAAVPKMCRRCKPGVCVHEPCTNTQQGGVAYCSESDCKTAEGKADMCVGCNYKDRYCSMADTEEYVCGASKYHITFNAGNGGTVSNAGQNEKNPGDSIDSTATPSEGYLFDGWEGSGGGTVSDLSNPTLTITNINSDATYTAKFKEAETPEPGTVTLQYTVKPAGSGKVINKTTSEDITNKVLTINKGSDGPLVKAEANDGYRFVQWCEIMDGIEGCQYGGGAEIIARGLSSNKVYEARFVKSTDPIPLNNCTGFTLACGENNTILVNWNSLPGTARYVVRIKKASAVGNGSDTSKTGDVWISKAENSEISTGGNVVISRGDGTGTSTGDPTVSKRSVNVGNGYRSFDSNVLSTVFEDIEPGVTYGVSVVPYYGPDDNVHFHENCGITSSADLLKPPLYQEIACDGTTPIVVPGGTVPETAIFDDTKDTLLLGFGILIVGLGWTWIATLPKKAYKLISDTSDSVSKYVSNVKVKQEKNVRDSRRNRLERRIK